MKTRTSHFCISVLYSTSMMALCVGAASAQTAPVAAADQSEEAAGGDVIVTARKREERLIEVPISITAFSAGDIQNKQIRDLRDVASLSPNVTFQDNGGRNTPALFIRGVVNTATVGRLATTAVFVDGIYVLGGLSSVNTSDAERIEVIKGPQNAYFGRNTFAGAINIITKDPSDTFGGQIASEATARGSYNLTASLEGPIAGDRLTGRIVLGANRKAPMYTATDGGKLGEETTRQVSATLLAKPTDSLTIRLRADYQHNDDGPPKTGYLRGVQYGNNCAGTAISGGDINGNRRDFAVTMPYFCGKIPGIDQLGEGVVTSNTTFASSFWTQLSGNPNIIRDTFVNNSLNAPYVAKAPSIDHFGMVRDIYRLSGSLDYEISDYLSTIVNLGYNRNNTVVIQDTDRTDAQNIYAIFPGLYRDFSAEFRIQSSADHRFRWMLGANYYDSKTDYNGSGDVTFQVRFQQTALFPQTTSGALFAPQNANGETANVLAGFGSAEFDILDGLTISGEMRYQRDRSKTPSDPIPAEFKDWLPRAILKYQPNSNWSMYATWSKGVLPGQFNTQYRNASPADKAQIDILLPGSTDQLPSQKLQNYELGMKQSLFNRKFSYSLAVYKMKWDNLPSSSALSVPGSTVRYTALITSGNATLKGIEFEGNVRPLRGLDINFGVSWQEGKYDSYKQGLLATGLVLGMYDFKGKHLPRMPDWQGNVSVNYSHALTGDWNWFGGGEVKYTGGMWDSEANIVKTDAFARVNARFGIENGPVSIEIFAKNLLNDNSWDFAVRNVSFAEPGSQQLPFNGGQQFFQGLYVGAPDKREVGLRTRFKF